MDRQQSTPQCVVSGPLPGSQHCPRLSFPQEPAGKMQAHGRGWPPHHPRLSFIWGDIGGGLGRPCPLCSPGEQGDKSPCLHRWPRNGCTEQCGPCHHLSFPAHGLGPPLAAAPMCRQWTLVPPGKVDSTSTCCVPGPCDSSGAQGSCVLIGWPTPQPCRQGPPGAHGQSFQVADRPVGRRSLCHHCCC